MIQTLRYEPRGQRQRFEPREQQRGEQHEQDRHIHLHFHLNLTFRARQGRSIYLNAGRVTRIFSALFAATVLFLEVFLWALLIHDGPPDPLLSPGNLASLIVFAGLALAWGFGCLPLLVSVWRANPRGRFDLFVPSILLLSISSLFLLAEPLSALLTWVHPLITALLLLLVSREARALREEAPAHSRLSFVLVSGMVITLLGGLLWNLSAVLGSLPFVWAFAPFLPAMGTAVIVAIGTLAWLFRSRGRMQAHPKDASPFDTGSAEEL